MAEDRKQIEAGCHCGAVNVACLDGISPFDFAEVPVMDGISHPDDTHAGPRLAGTLRFDPAS